MSRVGIVILNYSWSSTCMLREVVCSNIWSNIWRITSFSPVIYRPQRYRYRVNYYSVDCPIPASKKPWIFQKIFLRANAIFCKADTWILLCCIILPFLKKPTCKSNGPDVRNIVVKHSADSFSSIFVEVIMGNILKRRRKTYREELKDEIDALRTVWATRYLWIPREWHSSRYPGWYVSQNLTSKILLFSKCFHFQMSLLCLHTVWCTCI